MIGDNDNNNNANRQHNEVMGQKHTILFKKCLFFHIVLFHMLCFLNSKLCIVYSMQQTNKKLSNLSVAHSWTSPVIMI